MGSSEHGNDPRSHKMWSISSLAQNYHHLSSSAVLLVISDLDCREGKQKKFKTKVMVKLFCFDYRNSQFQKCLSMSVDGVSLHLHTRTWTEKAVSIDAMKAHRGVSVNCHQSQLYH